VSNGLDRRPLSVLRIGFPEFPSVIDTLDPDAAGERLSELLDLLTAPVLRQDGTVLHYDQAVLLAVWGAPHPQADHARLALLAAEASMRAGAAAVRGSPLRVLGGVATGEALVGIAGSRIRKTYGVFGGLSEEADRLFWDAGRNRLAVSARAWREAGRVPYAGNPDPVVLAF
jgi:adenylate cyclase